MSELEIRYLYGTAWKEELTEACVLSALSAGYRAIDTANQRKHYDEEAVGRAIVSGYSQFGLKREDLFLQTKFTFARGQDHRKPYDESAPFKDQVNQSIQSSLRHLQTDFIDSYVLHGPSSHAGLTNADLETWQAMQENLGRGYVRSLGISNVSFDQLAELCQKVTVQPKFVQNRCFATTLWDKEVREFCLAKGIHYQGFSLLTANSNFLAGRVIRPEGRNVPQLILPDGATDAALEGLHPEVRAILKQTGKNIQQVIFRFAQQIGMIPITGTRSVDHLRSNLEIDEMVLSASQLRTLETIAFLE